MLAANWISGCANSFRVDEIDLSSEDLLEIVAHETIFKERMTNARKVFDQ